jgi:hypothetical protein
MDKNLVLRPNSAMRVFGLRAAILLGAGMLLATTAAGCSQQTPVANTPESVKAALTPPKLDPVRLAKEEAIGQARSAALLKMYEQMHSAAHPYGNPLSATAPPSSTSP